MKLREFVGTKDEYPNETAIVLTTNDYNNINVWQEAENSSFKKIGAFNASEIDNAMHGEKKISRFLENKFDLKNIYSLNDFHSIYEISTTENIDSTNDIQKIANNTSYMNIGLLCKRATNHGRGMLKRLQERRYFFSFELRVNS